MGSVAARYADLAIVTSDNPRSENPLEIISEIISGMPREFDYEIEPDRAAAIRRAAFLSRSGDLVLIAGKGHENYQEIDGVRRPFDDREIVKNL